MKLCILTLSFLFAFTILRAGDFNAKKNTLNKVFNDLVNAYGNAKAAPAWKLNPKTSGEIYIATYSASPPTIIVDEKLFDICMKMGPDSLNALSIVLSHELAHYYNDHQWCTDFAFALSKLERSKLEKQKNYWHSKEEKIIHEGEADNFGLYHSCIAGYQPFNIFSRLLDTIYSPNNYHLPDIMYGYPTKKERVQICNEAQMKIRILYREFVEGDTAIQIGDFGKAIKCFDDLVKFFPSRENYNNLGTAKTLLAIKLKPLERKEFIDTNFYYPIEIDHRSRLKTGENRSTNENDSKRIDLLMNAKRDFEKAISLDPDYYTAFINLACVFDMLDKPEAAIGKIREMPIDKQSQKKVYRILGVAYYHANNKEMSKEMFERISKY